MANCAYQKIKNCSGNLKLARSNINLKLHTTSPEQNTFLLSTNSWTSLKMHCNCPSKWIMRSPKKQAWCRGVSKWQCKNTYKTCNILHICSKCQENYVFRIQWFSTKMSKSLFGSPRAPVERPETPRDASDSPDKHQNQCQRTQNHVKFIGFHGILWISLHSIGFYGFHCIP